MNNQYGVIVLGGHVQGLGIVRILGERGITCVVFDCTSMNIARHSKYCKSFIKYEKGKLLNLLIELIKKGHYKNWLVIPTDDSQIHVLSTNYSYLTQHFKLSVQEWNKIEIFYNKKLTYKLCKELNVPIAKTYFPDNENDLKEYDLNFPLIIKPAVMHTFYSKTKKKVFLCNNLNELIEAYRIAGSIIPKDEIIIQEVIQGDGENQYSVCFYFNNEPIVSLIAKRCRQHPIEFGNATTFAETVPGPKIIYDYATRILKDANYVGLAEVEFKFDELSGEYKFLEVNPRSWKWHTIARHSNSPFIESMYMDIIYGKKIISNTWQKAYFRDIITDLPVKLKLIKRKKYVPKKYKKIVHAVWDLNDLKPFMFELIYLPYLILKR